MLKIKMVCYLYIGCRLKRQLLIFWQILLFIFIAPSFGVQASDVNIIKPDFQFNTMNTKHKTSMQKPEYNPEDHPSKHCVSKISIKTQNIYLFENWYDQAKTKSKQNWQETVKKRYGSVYSNWPVSINKKDRCTRIGIASNEEGKVGVYVLCSVSAVPCTRLSN